MDTDVYKLQRKRALRYAAENNTDVWGGMLPVLETMLPNLNELSMVSLGVVEVPVSKIYGTVNAGRSQAFSGNFLPALPETSEFAMKWMSLYKAHENVGIRDSCTGLEYLGKYYIAEGHKRVSVLKAADAATVSIEVQRVIPHENADDAETLIYREFLSVDLRLPLRDMWFSARGSFTELHDMAKRGGTQNPVDTLFDAYHDFRVCYLDMGLKHLTVTTGDAFLSYSRVFGLPYLKSREELLGNIKKLEKRLDYIYSAEPLERHNTFYGKYTLAAFILGALAGSLSLTNRIGWSGGIFSEDDIEWFINGAKMTNSHAELFGSDFDGNDIDIALLPYSDDMRGPGFSGMFARLAGLTVPHGYVSEYYAALSRDFGAFYALTDSEDLLLDGVVRKELGLESGFLRLSLNKPVLSPQTLKIVEILGKTDL
ncbi:MAG: hypothetical protein FWG36_06800 [Oscillospiraceae bacterium]|nr:hypothetical protein [Oscillospiraceae bacterium]